jgi:AcrR family transcriptional regulator
MSGIAPNTADENARYKRAIRAAETLFKKVGFRAVTMELVAREADVAKATLYSYFKNKDELFLAVCARMASLLRGAVEQALMKPDIPLDARLSEAVIAKHRMIFTLVRGSAHAAELFGSSLRDYREEGPTRYRFRQCRPWRILSVGEHHRGIF